MVRAAVRPEVRPACPNRPRHGRCLGAHRCRRLRGSPGRKSFADRSRWASCRGERTAGRPIPTAFRPHVGKTAGACRPGLRRTPGAGAMLDSLVSWLPGRPGMFRELPGGRAGLPLSDEAGCAHVPRTHGTVATVHPKGVRTVTRLAPSFGRGTKAAGAEHATRAGRERRARKARARRPRTTVPRTAAPPCRSRRAMRRVRAAADGRGPHPRISARAGRTCCAAERSGSRTRPIGGWSEGSLDGTRRTAMLDQTDV